MSRLAYVFWPVLIGLIGTEALFEDRHGSGNLREIQAVAAGKRPHRTALLHPPVATFGFDEPAEPAPRPPAIVNLPPSLSGVPAEPDRTLAGDGGLIAPQSGQVCW